ncbi:Clathrin heavy chain 1 [Thelohanellus kitauei]|uniref:Clathrin heavy chain 1 n=1 Tax=Thelohanellus kitauei TaxID=669202 RepID=A0A0C2N4M4_THEKT|nr:Clathrin heavy chain 1 [Thelohanellus kitauei]
MGVFANKGLHLMSESELNMFPIKLTKKCDLQSLGIPLRLVHPSFITIDSKEYVCLVDPKGPETDVTVINTSNPDDIRKFSFDSDMVRINPDNKVLAVKTLRKIVVINLETMEQINEASFDEEIMFFKWISVYMIGVVTQTSIYHWSIEDIVAPLLMIQDNRMDSNKEVFDYQVDSTTKWCAVISTTDQHTEPQRKIRVLSFPKEFKYRGDGHVGCFLDLHTLSNPNPTKLFIFTSQDNGRILVSFREIGITPAGNQPFEVQYVNLFEVQDNETDVPVGVCGNEKCGILTLITRNGYVYIINVESSDLICAVHLIKDTVAVSVPMAFDYDSVVITRNGYVETVGIDKDNIIPYLFSIDKNVAAFQVSYLSGYPGSENILLEKFNEYFSLGKYVEASKIAARSRGSSIRNAETIIRFKTQSSLLKDKQKAGQLPIFIYFHALLENGKLNQLESMEICNMAFLQNKMTFLQHCFIDDKLECTKELGDLVRPHNLELASSIYLKANCHDKVVEYFAEMGEFQKITRYCKRVKHLPDYTEILHSIIYKKSKYALKLSVFALRDYERLDLEKIGNFFMDVNAEKQYLIFMSRALTKNLPKHAKLQTEFLEKALELDPQIAEKMIVKKILTHFDKKRIVKACESVGLIERSLELYSNIEDIKRMIILTDTIKLEWLVKYFGSLSVDHCLACLETLLKHNSNQNLSIAVKVAAEYHYLLGTNAIAKVFKDTKCSHGISMVLDAINKKDKEANIKSGSSWDHLRCNSITSGSD